MYCVTAVGTKNNDENIIGILTASLFLHLMNYKTDKNQTAVNEYYFNISTYIKSHSVSPW